MPERMRLPSRATWAVATAVLAMGCAHGPRSEVTLPADALRCEDAGRVLDARARTSALDDLRRSATHPLSLAVSGGGWVTDGAIVVAAGVAAGGLVCAPVFAIEVAAKADGRASAECVLRVGGAVVAITRPGIGSGVYRATRSWRCPEFVPLAREVLAVAACHSSRNLPGDAELALRRVLQLRSDREIWECLPASVRSAVEAALTVPPDQSGPPLVPRP